jgi:hypothetical protein
MNMSINSFETAPAVDCELALDDLDSVAGGQKGGPVQYEDGILAIGIPGVVGIFIGGGCVGGWLGKVGVAFC